jgi:hypothetical protein
LCYFRFSIQDKQMKSPTAGVVLLSLCLVACASDLDGWRRPGENDTANRHDIEACTAEANAVAAAGPHEPSLSDDNLAFGDNPSSYFAAEPRMTADPAGRFLSSQADARWRTCLEARGFTRSQ